MTSVVTILLVDEEPILRRATALMLANRGGDVTDASTADEAAAVAGRRTFDVAVLDATPGGPSAAEMLRRMRERGVTARRTIAISSAPLDRREATEFAGVLRKPYRFELLLTAVFGAARAARIRRRRAARRRDEGRSIDAAQTGPGPSGAEGASKRAPRRIRSSRQIGARSLGASSRAIARSRRTWGLAQVSAWSAREYVALRGSRRIARARRDRAR